MADHLRGMRIYERDLGVERTFRDRSNPLEHHSDDEFRCRLGQCCGVYGFSGRRFTVCHLPKPSFDPCTCLRFLATAAFHLLVSVCSCLG